MADSIGLSVAPHFPNVIGKENNASPAAGGLKKRLSSKSESSSLAVTGTVAEFPDETLIESIHQGAMDALTQLFHRYARLVRTVAFRILRDEAEADDLLQEVFLFIQRNSSSFDPSKATARSWIVNIAYDRAIDRRRYLNTRHFYTSLGVDDPGLQLADPRTSMARSDEALDAELAKKQLEKALDALTGGQRETLHLYFFEGYTLSEIADKLQQSQGNIRNHYYRGLEKLRKQLLGKKAPLRVGL